ncbi:unnamed protein product [Boreogadus saida]
MNRTGSVLWRRVKASSVLILLSLDLLPMSVESVFIFQEASETEPSTPAPAYDAIVVEQWTVIDTNKPLSAL